MNDYREHVVFIVYARADEDLKDRLLKHLSPLKQKGRLSTWHDKEITGGEDWEKAINEAMVASDLILLLVSPDFMASDYIQSKELADALARHEAGTARVIPVFARPAYWQIADFARLQGFPRNGQAVDSRHFHSIDEALLEVTVGVEGVLDDLDAGERDPFPIEDDSPPEEIEEVRSRSGGDTQEPAAEKVEITEVPALVLAEEARDSFHAQNENRPMFRLFAAPSDTSDVVDVDSKDVKDLLLMPPGQRPSGWNMGFGLTGLDFWQHGIEKKTHWDRRLRLATSGCMEFTHPLDERFCWRQSDEEFQKAPRLYPYPVFEYPLSFLDLYKRLADLLQLSPPFMLEMEYWNLEGYYLNPYAPGQVGFEFPIEQRRRYPDRQFLTTLQIETRDFDPAHAAALLLKPLYRAFGYGTEAIPTYDKETDRLTFDLAGSQL